MASRIMWMLSFHAADAGSDGYPVTYDTFEAAEAEARLLMATEPTLAWADTVRVFTVDGFDAMDVERPAWGATLLRDGYPGDDGEAAPPPPAAPLLQRLGEAHDGLSDMAGIVVSHECVEAVSDAYDTLASLRDALFDMAQKAEWAAMPAAGAVERQTALSEIAAAARAAIAKVGG